MFTFFLKEIRQLRRDMVFCGALIVQVALSTLIILLLFYQQKDLDEKILYTPWFATLGFAGAFAIAIAMASRWNSEISDDALNPIITTPIPAGMVAAGKYLATFIAVLLPVAIAQIFVGFTIPKAISDIHFSCFMPTDAVLILLSAATLLVCASIAGKHSILGVIMPGVVMIIFMLSYRSASLEINQTVFDQPDGMKTLGYTWARLLLLLPMCFAITAAAISPRSSDRAIPVRIVLVITLAAYMISNYIEDSSAPKTYIYIYLLAGAVFSIVAALAQRRAQTPRVMATVRRLPPPLRPLRILCSTGAIPELVFSLVLFAGTMTAVNRIDPEKNIYLGVAFIYTSTLFCAALPLAIASIIKMTFGKKVHTALMYAMSWGASMLLGMLIAANASMTDEHSEVLPVVIGAISLVLLLPTAWEFIDSLKRR